MLEITGQGNIYLALETTDMRRSINGLSAIVLHEFKLDPLSDAWFVFCSRNRTRLKILRWDKNGWWLYYRVLDREKFQWPKEIGTVKQIDFRSLRWLLDGLDIEQPRAHKPIKVKYLF